MAENNDKPIYISFTIEGQKGFSYTITKLPPLVPGLKCIQRYEVSKGFGGKRIIYTDDLLFWTRLEKNHYNNFRDETFNYFISEKDLKKPDFKEYLFALLGKDYLGPEKFEHVDEKNSEHIGEKSPEYIGALIQGKNGHYTVNKKPLVEAIIPFLDKKLDYSDKYNNMSLRDLLSDSTKGLLMTVIVKAVDSYVYLERSEEKRQQIMWKQDDGR